MITTQVPRPHVIALAAAQAATLLLATAAVAVQAQETGSQTLERVEITGSSIKRLEGETALPVQTIKREDIAKTGATTAAELMRNISGNAAGLTDGASISDNNGGQRGFNGANLRGIGVSSTLVLLNGRRLANFASPGDSAGVDLNNIPAGAIERVEILKDGASAIYGTDAIGGVINFITRKDYRGVDLNASLSGTQEGGAGKRTASVAAGYGDLGQQGFNVFGVLDVQKLDALRSTQRDFLKERPLSELLPYYMSSRPYPANLRLSGNAATRAAQLAAINAAGYTIGGKPFTDRTVNLFAPSCNPPASVFTPGTQTCGYDYMADTEIYPDASKTSFLGRGVLKLGDRSQAFVEILRSQARTTYVLSPNPTNFSGVSVAALNQNLPRPINYSGTVEVRMRATELGNRSNEVTSDAERYVAGVTGSFANDWDYTVAASYARNKSQDKYVNGYFLFDQLDAGVKSGLINPFGPSSAAGKALIDAIRVNDVARRSSGITQGLDAKLTGSLMELAGGPLGVALGAELRRESQRFTPSALLVSNNIGGDRDSSLDPGVPDTSLKATSNGRNIASAYTELNAPLSKELELQAALRFDRYQGVGSTTNPKLGVRYQPSRQLLLRASAGTGFRAPSFSELYRPTSYGSSPAFIYDKVLDSFDQWATRKEANPNLKPERSQQFSAGLVVEPARDISLSLDYWLIKKRDVISDLYEKTILENPERYAPYIERNEFDEPTIVLRKENQGRLKTSGLDLEANLRSGAGAWGRFALNLSGTYILEYKRQFGPLEPYVSNVGRFLNDQVIQRWRHRASVDWEFGDINLTLGNTFYAGYRDDSYLPDTAPRRVKAYSLWDVSGAWKVNKMLRVRAGIQNLADTAPPFSNQSYYFLSTYDPTYTDPRGRTFYASVNLSFK
ncbi:TonB-dependent receptor [Roseateles chitosanitabidus]|uniref:TonB-dependent receptor n=1 Tax=Roseateles chitosanitabidus TaxID=65048 RepID=UPI00082A5E92|nr:TonB-dependent receptor [Roseateles chitosanitabidus]